MIADTGIKASDFATSVQGDKADTALQSGANITELTNNAGYLDATTGVEPGDNITTLTNNAGYLDAAAGNAAYLGIGDTAVEATAVTGQEGGGASWKIQVGGTGPGTPGDGTLYFRTS